MPIGVSSGNENDWFIDGPFIFCNGGTLGFRAIDDQGNADPNDDAYFAVSNNHVYARENAASIGENILQPGLNDTNCSGSSGDIIGQVSDFEPINFNNTVACNPPLAIADCNTMDAAVASTTTASVGNSTPSNGYGTPDSTTVAAFVGQEVQKYGRTTSLTQGTVIVINATVTVDYGDSGLAEYVDQIVFTDISGPGDSGSLIVTNDGNNNPVALLFASGPTATIGSPIGLVLTRFGVTIDGEAAATPTPTPTDTPTPTPPTPTPPTPTPTPTDTPTPTPPTPTPTDTPTPTPPTPTPTDTPTPTPADDIHVGDLDYTSEKLSKGNWKAVVTITVHDVGGGLVAGAEVTGDFSQKGAVVASGVMCTTAADGTCTADSGQFPSKSGKDTSYTVTAVSYIVSYDAGANHDPDGESDGTTIDINK